MSHLTIRLIATVGATAVGPSDPWIQNAGPQTAIGWGHVTDTLTDDGDGVEALVVMHEPALPGLEVTAHPVAVLHVADGPPRDELLCVADEPSFAGLLDDPRLLPPSPVDPWAHALTRLTSRQVTVDGPCGSRDEAEHVLRDAQVDYLRSTGSLE
jgi:inorganic pyrophosphatase